MSGKSTAVTRREYRVVRKWGRSGGLVLPSPREGSPAIRVRRSGNVVAEFFPGDAIGPKDLPSKDAFDAQVRKGRIVTEAEWKAREEANDGEA